jgi:hypothetical protein
MKATAAEEARTTALLCQVVTLLERIANKLDPPKPDVDVLLDEIAPVVKGDSFRVSSLFKQAELDNDEGDSHLLNVLTSYSGMNRQKLGKLFSAIEGPRLTCVRRDRGGNVWRLKM